MTRTRPSPRKRPFWFRPRGKYTKQNDLVRIAGVDKGIVETNSSNTDSQVEDVASDSDHNKEARNIESIFKKLKNNLSARAYLASIHAARSYKIQPCLIRSQKLWYKESTNISKKLTSRADRRKFRQGLKCNIDFSN